MAEAVSEQVRAGIARVKRIPVERVQLSDSLEALGVDSLDAITLLFDLEEVFHISIPDEKVRAMRTVQDIVDNIDHLRGGAAQAAHGS